MPVEPMAEFIFEDLLNLQNQFKRENASKTMFEQAFGQLIQTNVSEVLVRYISKHFVARNDWEYFRYQVQAQNIDQEMETVMKNMELCNKAGGDKNQLHQLCT
jgi:hypothetical protein